MAWIGAGVGGAGSAGIGAGAEGWLAYEHVGIGVHDSAVDQWFGDHRAERSVLLGYTSYFEVQGAQLGYGLTSVGLVAGKLR